MPLDVVIPSQRAYYFVYPKVKRLAHPVQAFRNWLHAEIKRSEQ
jgi:DNA-binding transcriptional LysR family regulator